MVAVEIDAAEIAFDSLVVVVCWRLSLSADISVSFVALSFGFVVLSCPTPSSLYLALSNVPV